MAKIRNKHLIPKEIIAAAMGDAELMTDVIMLRGVLSQFMHIAETAIAGAAIWMVTGCKKFAVGMFKDGKFWKLFLVSVVLHMIWNVDFNLPYFLKQIALGAIAWTVILALIQEGLKELRKMQGLEFNVTSDGRYVID